MSIAAHQILPSCTATYNDVAGVGVGVLGQLAVVFLAGGALLVLIGVAGVLLALLLLLLEVVALHVSLDKLAGGLLDGLAGLGQAGHNDGHLILAEVLLLLQALGHLVDGGHNLVAIGLGHVDLNVAGHVVGFDVVVDLRQVICKAEGDHHRITR